MSRIETKIRDGENNGKDKGKSHAEVYADF